MLKPELYGIIKNYKPRYISYKIDKLFIDRGFDVVRLPPDLNPIELVWAELKKNVGNKNITFKFSDVISLADKFFEEEFSIEKWSKICNRVERLEKEFISKEPTIDLVVEQLIINLGEDSDTESEYSSAEELDFDALEGIEELDDESVPNQSEVTSSLTYTVW
jgi:hypothetical protein